MHNSDSQNTSLDYIEVFPWNKSFETGIEEVDEQHKMLIVLINKLVNTLVHNEELAVNEAFAELAAYADYHFAAEEKVWAEHLQDDEWVSAHRKNHTSFLPQVLEIKERDADKPLHDVIEDIVRFLIRWLAFHIIDDDKRLAIAIHAMEQGASIAEAKHLAEEEMNDSVSLLIDIVLNMYDSLSSRTLNLMRERRARMAAEAELREANRKLEALSITDQLTGLYNRRHFEEIFDRELHRARRDQHYLTLLLFDIDHFKRLNDHYGHAQGDHALRQVSAELQALCRRGNDYAFRVGGEEFAVICSGTAPDAAAEMAERVRTGLAALQIPNQHSDAAAFLTISLGAVSCIPGAEDSLDSMMTIADQRLYQAKRQGRNCAVTTGQSALAG